MQVFYTHVDNFVDRKNKTESMLLCFVLELWRAEHATKSAWWRHCSETVFSAITSLFFVLDRKYSLFEISEFFYVYANFQFSWWSRDQFSEPFRGIFGHILSRLAKGTSRVGFPSVPLVWGKTVSSRLCAGQSKGTLKTQKCCFWIWLRPR